MSVMTDDDTVFVLYLNDMRANHIEDIEPVAAALSRESLIAFMNRERVDHYTTPNEWGGGRAWSKSFREGGPLEWYNQPFNLDHAIQEKESPAQVMQRYKDALDKLLLVAGQGDTDDNG